MVPKKPKEDQKPEKSKIAQESGVGMGAQFEGEKIDKADVDGKEVILVDFAFMPNKFKSTWDDGTPAITAILQVEVDGELRILYIGGRVVVEGLKAIESRKDELLPGPVTFAKDKTQDGKRTFWTMR